MAIDRVRPRFYDNSSTASAAFNNDETSSSYNSPSMGTYTDYVSTHLVEDSSTKQYKNGDAYVVVSAPYSFDSALSNSFPYGDVSTFLRETTFYALTNESCEYNGTTYRGVNVCTGGRGNGGSPKIYQRGSLCNCVGLAWGAFNHTWYLNNSSNWEENGFVSNGGDANKMLDDGAFLVKDGNGNYVQKKIKSPNGEYTDFINFRHKPSADYTPPIGGLVNWDNIHTGYIVDVLSNGDIAVLQSAWEDVGASSYGRYCWYLRIHHKSTGYAHEGTPAKYFLENPGIYYASNPLRVEVLAKTTKQLKLKVVAPSLTQFQSSSIQLTYTNFIPSRFYPQGGIVVPKEIDKDGEQIFVFNTPRESSSVTIESKQTPVGGEEQTTILLTEDLPVSHPMIKLQTDTGWNDYVPMIFDGGNWKPYVPILCRNGHKYALFNTDKEMLN